MLYYVAVTAVIAVIIVVADYVVGYVAAVLVIVKGARQEHQDLK